MVAFTACAVPDCYRNAHWRARGVRGWCSIHYKRWKRYGDPLMQKRIANGVAQRYFEEIVLAYDGDECLTWPYAKSAGYGHIRIEGQLHLVSRLVCERTHGPAPTPLHEAAHSCGRGHFACVAKRHLSWKTPEGNAADKIGHGTTNRGERCGTSKLTESDVLAIRAARGKVTGISLAARFGVSPSTIARVQLQHGWQWIDTGSAEDREPGAEG